MSVLGPETGPTEAEKLLLIRNILRQDNERLEKVRTCMESPSLHLPACKEETPLATPNKVTFSTLEPFRTPNASSNNNNSVFNRLYEKSKLPKSKPTWVAESPFKPSILPKSRLIASQKDRSQSLYDRAVQRNHRQQKRIEESDQQLAALRNSSKQVKRQGYDMLKRELSFYFQPDVDQETLELLLQHFHLPATELSIPSLFSEGSRVDFATFWNLLVELNQSKHPGVLESLQHQVLLDLRAYKRQALHEETTCPFAPIYVNSKSTVLDELRTAKLGIPQDLPREAKLYEVAAKRKVQLEANKKALLKAEMQECTFHPQLIPSQIPNNNTYHVLTVGEEIEEEEVAERLYKESFVRRGRLEEKRAEQALLLLQEQRVACTFHPQLVTKSRPQPAAPPGTVQPQSRNQKKTKNLPRRTFSDTLRSSANLQEQHTSHVSTKGNQFSRALYPSKLIFQAEIALPNGRLEMLELREGENGQKVVERFCAQHGLDPSCHRVLLESLPIQQEEEDEIATEEEEDEDSVEVEVLGPGGDVYRFQVKRNEDISTQAQEFAKEVGLDANALDQLVESLKNVLC